MLPFPNLRQRQTTYAELHLYNLRLVTLQIWIRIIRLRHIIFWSDWGPSDWESYPSIYTNLGHVCVFLNHSVCYLHLVRSKIYTSMTLRHRFYHNLGSTCPSKMVPISRKLWRWVHLWSHLFDLQFYWDYHWRNFLLQKFLW